MGEDDGGEYVPLAELYAGAEDDAIARVERRDDLDRARSARTTEAWLIALMPAFALIADIAFLSFVDDAAGVLAVVLITVLATVVSISLARNDQTRLIALGHVARTQPYFAVLPALYLFVRGHRAYQETFEGMGAAWTSLAVLIVAGYSAVVVVPAALTIGDLLRQSMEQIAQ